MRKLGNGANVAAEMELENNTTNLFLTSSIEEGLDGAVWLVNSGCSNHMTSMRSLFNDLDETYKEKVHLGDNKDLAVEGKGTVSFHTNGGKVKLLHDVQFVPTLAHNLLSVGQLISLGHSVIFEGNHCLIKDGQTGNTLVSIKRTKNNMFPLQVESVGLVNTAVNPTDNS